MKYNIKNTIPESKFLFFWGHQPNNDESISKTCFSQWWLSSFEVENDLQNRRTLDDGQKSRII